MRAARMACLRAIAGLSAIATGVGCAELGVVGDGTSISVGKPSHGYIVDGARLPDAGEGFCTREIWQHRGQRYATDELIDLITAVSRRMMPKTGGIRLVIADLSGRGGGAARLWHRSHQSGRDVDLVYYMRDRDGRPIEADAMRVFDATGTATDGTGITVDVPRMWLLVKELIDAPEAPVQWLFMYEPIAARLVEHAIAHHESEAVIAKVRKALKQPGDSARHDDHMHVRVYCAAADRAYGCVDIGPMELLAERDAEMSAMGGAIAAALDGSAAVVAAQAPTAAGAVSQSNLESLGRLLRTRSHRIDLRRWR